MPEMGGQAYSQGADNRFNLVEEYHGRKYYV